MSDGNGQNQAPAGWYPDDHGNQRWWDGARWTDQVQTDAEPDAAASSPVAVSDAGTKAASAQFYTKKWFIGVVAAVIGIGIGAASAGSADPKGSDEYKTISSELEDSKSELNRTKGDLADSEKAASQVNQVADREAALESREADVAAAEAKVKQDAAKVLKREKAVGIVEQDIEANTIGNGVYEVGVDMKPGRYKTAGPTDSDVPFCSYRVSSDEAGEDIITIENVQGPGIVSLAKGQFFFSQLCKDWTLQWQDS